MGLTGVMVACLSLVHELKEKRKRKRRGSEWIFENSKKTKELRFLQLLVFLWTSLGLNQGPPDYESVALTN